MGEDDDFSEVDKVLAGQKQQTDATKGLLNTMKAANKLQADYTKQISGITKMLSMKRKFGIAKDPEMVNTLKALKQQLKDIKKDLRVAQKADVQTALKKAGKENTGTHWMQSFKTSMTSMFAPLTKAFKPLTSVIGKIGSRVSGSLKKSGMMPMLGMAGAGILAGVLGKVVSSSPLLQSMMKMMNMGMTLIFRPIGDFIGSIMRPLMISFIKDIAVPFFKASKNMMKEGEKIGKGLLGFFTDPIKSIHSAIILGLHSVLPSWMLGGTDVIKEAQAFQANPTAFARRGAGVGEFSRSKSFSIVPTDAELLDAGYTAEEISNMDEFRTGYSWRKLQKAREDDLIPTGDHLDERGETLFGISGSSMTGGTNMQNTTVHGKTLPMSDAAREWYKKLGVDTKIEGGETGTTKSGECEWWDVGCHIRKAMEGADDGIIPKVNAEEEEEGDRHNDETESDNEDTENDRDEEHTIRETANDQLEQDTNQSGYINDSINKGNQRFAISIMGAATQTEKATTSWWDNLMGFFGLQEKESSLKEDQISEEEKILDLKKENVEETDKADKEWHETLWDMITGTKLNALEMQQSFKAVENVIETASDEIALAGQTAIYGNNAGRNSFNNNTGTSNLLSTGTTHGTTFGGDPNAALGSGYSATVTTTPPIMSEAEAAEAALNLTGGVMGLGDIAGNKFETSPGQYSDIYKTVDGEKVKIDPSSKEGKIIQGIYQKQLENKIQNAAQGAHVAAVGSFTTAAESQAYVMAGGGQAGLEAAAVAKEKGLDLQTHEGLAALAGEVGGQLAEHPHAIEAMVQTAGGSWHSTQTGALAAAIAASKEANPQAWADAIGDSDDGDSDSDDSDNDSDGGGSGGWVNPAAIKYNPPSNQGGVISSSTNKNSNTSSNTSSTGNWSGGGFRAANRFGGIIDEPILGFGMNTGTEYSFGEGGREKVIPMDSTDNTGLGDIIINIGNITKEADYMKLKPLIQRWILEAASRRGTV